jgi:Flp pilus assembly protein TadD
LCVRHLEQEPHDTVALTLMSRLCLLAGDLGSAIACARIAVRVSPADAGAREALDAAMARRPDPALARERLQQALDIEPEIAAYALCYGSAPPFARIEDARRLLEDAVRLDPSLAQAHAALANVLARQNHTLLAIPAYRRALDIDPNQPDAALALSELLFDIGDTGASAAYRTQALSQKRLYGAGPRSSEAATRALVLNAPAPWAQNTPLEFMIDPRAAALTRLYLTGDPLPEALPHYDVIFNAIGEAERAHGAIALAREFITEHQGRVVNRPEHLWKTARPNVVQTLSGVSGCTVPQADRLTRKELAAWKRFPLLIRPIDTHAGRGLEKIDAPDDLAQYLAKSGEARFDAVPFVDYRNDDGYYRKYRVVLVDGVPYPYHLAISPGWMVHYIKTPTASVKWMRDEELRFLRDPHSVFTSWDRTFTEMAQAMGLDYFGIDCALLPDGNVLVFEVDTAMLVHCREPADSYKHQYVPRIFRAVEALLAKR